MATPAKPKPWDDKAVAGDWNTAPAGFRRITEAEYAARIIPTHWECHQYRQLTRTIDGRKLRTEIPDLQYDLLDCVLIWFGDGTGVGMSTRIERAQRVGMEYWAFGCNHAYRELSQDECRRRGIHHYGMFCHVRECANCGMIRTDDSSG